MKKNLNISKALFVTVILNSSLIVVVILASIYWLRYEYFSSEAPLENINILLLFAILTVVLSSLVTLRDRYAFIKAERRYNSLKTILMQMENLNNTLRAQRHDFLNQLQVVYSLIEMDEFNEAKNYIEKVYQDIQKVSTYLKTACPAVNALLQAKMLTCEKNGIDMQIKVSSQLQSMSFPAWELCRILGNLLDNSIYALHSNEIKKHIWIEIYQDIKYFGFKISNNGPMIEKEHIEKIFLPGFSTKGGEGEGMGLSIVKEILEINNGTIKVLSTHDLTVFEVTIPR